MKYIVTTTIHKPTPALVKWSQLPGWALVVVGDRKTPHEAYDGFNYLSPEAQEALDLKLSNLIGWNCIQRRNMGFVYAIRHGAEVVATVDDDNDPLPRWGETIVGKTVNLSEYQCDASVFDPLAVTNLSQLWHRGFPLQWVAARNKFPEKRSRDVKIDVEAGLWDGDQDIDAVCRMLTPGQHDMNAIKPYTSNKPSPFNSQATVFSRDALKHFFCFPGIGRMDDVYGSYVCQAHGFRVAYHGPTVRQDRNAQDTTRNFKDEVEGYLHCAELVTALAEDREAWRRFVPPRAAEAWDRYRELVTHAA